MAGEYLRAQCITIRVYMAGEYILAVSIIIKAYMAGEENGAGNSTVTGRAEGRRQVNGRLGDETREPRDQLTCAQTGVLGTI